MKKLMKTSKFFLTGKDFQFFDKLIFTFSNKKINGSIIGNKLRNYSLGKKKHRSDLPIIMIGGCPRSGTTLIQMLLKTFPKIDGPYNEICLPQDIVNEKRIKKEFEINSNVYSNLRAQSNEDVILFSELLLKNYQKKNKLDYILLKAPKYILFLDEIFKYFPNTKFIHIIRDGRDVVASMQQYYEKLEGKRYPLGYCARLWAVAINQGKKHRLNKNYMEIRYEDLLDNPYKIMKRVAKFLQIKPLSKQKIVSFHKQIDSTKIPTHKTQISKGLYKSKIGRWKNDFSEKDKEEFNKIAGNILRELKY